MQVLINDREVDSNTLEVSGIDFEDYPDFCDAYFSRACFTDGTELEEVDLEQLTENYGDLLYNAIVDKIY